MTHGGGSRVSTDFLLRVIVAFTLALTSTAASAGSALIEAPILPAAAPYFKSCEGLLDALTFDAVEEFFVVQATTPGERLQLLLDFRILFSPPFDEALRAADVFDGIAAWSFVRLQHRLVRLRKNPKSLRALAHDVLDRLADRDPGAARTMPERLYDQRTRRFIEALRVRPNYADWASLVAGAIDVVLAQTISNGRWMRVHGLTKSRILGAGEMSVALGGGIGFAPISHFIMPLLGPSVGAVCMAAIGVGAVVMTGVACNTLFDDKSSESFASRRAARSAWSKPVGRLQVDSRTLTDQTENGSNAHLALPWLDEVTKGHLDTCSPVELAYLGLIDVARWMINPIPPVVDDLRAAWTDLPVMEIAAEELMTRPDDTRAQLVFSGRVNEVNRRAGLPLWTLEDHLAGQRDELARLVTRFQDLEAHVFGTAAGEMTEDELRRREIIVARVRHDLPRIRELVVSGGLEGEVADRVRPLLASLVETVQPQPQTPADWRRAAARALDLANDFRRATDDH